MTTVNRYETLRRFCDSSSERAYLQQPFWIEVADSAWGVASDGYTLFAFRGAVGGPLVTPSDQRFMRRSRLLMRETLERCGAQPRRESLESLRVFAGDVDVHCTVKVGDALVDSALLARLLSAVDGQARVQADAGANGDTPRVRLLGDDWLAVLAGLGRDSEPGMDGKYPDEPKIARSFYLA